MKAFNNLRHNHIHITFPNGNCISCLWAAYSYSDNKDIWLERGAASFTEFLDSDTCEIKVIEAPQELVDKIQSKYGDPTDSVVGYVTVTQWLEILNMLAKE